MSPNSGGGIVFELSDIIQISTILVFNNTSIDNLGGGIYFESSKDIHISNSKFYNNTS